MLIGRKKLLECVLECANAFCIVVVTVHPMENARNLSLFFIDSLVVRNLYIGGY